MWNQHLPGSFDLEPRHRRQDRLLPAPVHLKRLAFGSCGASNNTGTAPKATSRPTSCRTAPRSPDRSGRTYRRATAPFFDNVLLGTTRSTMSGTGAVDIDAGGSPMVPFAPFRGGLSGPPVASPCDEPAVTLYDRYAGRRLHDRLPPRRILGSALHRGRFRSRARRISNL
jgi:hypothetical protein